MTPCRLVLGVGGFSKTSVIRNTLHEARSASLAKYLSERNVFRTKVVEINDAFHAHCKFSQVLRFS
jgi:hypothetical protein